MVNQNCRKILFERLRKPIIQGDPREFLGQILLMYYINIGTKITFTNIRINIVKDKFLKFYSITLTYNNNNNTNLP